MWISGDSHFTIKVQLEDALFLGSREDIGGNIQYIYRRFKFKREKTDKRKRNIVKTCMTNYLENVPEFTSYYKCTINGRSQFGPIESPNQRHVELLL